MVQNQETIIKTAQEMDCASFYKMYENSLECTDVENLMDFNEGAVNLLYRTVDTAPIDILFIDGEFNQWSY